MSNGPQQNTLLDRLQKKASAQASESQEQLQIALKDFDEQWQTQLATALRKTVNDMEDLHQTAQHLRSRTKAQIERELSALETTTQKAGSALSFTLWKAAMLSGFSLTLGACAVALGGFVTYGAMRLEPPAAATPQVPLALNESRVMRGVGGLGTIILLPSGVETTICPIGTSTDRICIQKP